MRPVDPWLEEFHQVERMLWETGLVSSHGGNMSRRLDDGGLILTRHGCPLGHLQEGDLMRVDANSLPSDQTSMDTALHGTMYAAQPQARAVIHAHPRHTIALSLMQEAIEPQDLEGRHYVKSIPVLPAEEIAQALTGQPIAVAQGHGSYAWGVDLWRALQWTSILEESAQVLWLLRSLAR
jgi:L-fuculose-phosphate aldolase